MKVSRGSFMGNPDWLFVTGEHGELMWHGAMQPGGLLHPHSAEEARLRPWFFTGSPYGADIIGLAWERHGVLTKQSSATNIERKTNEQ